MSVLRREWLTRAWALVSLLLAWSASPAAADVAGYVGKTVTAIRVESEGRTIADESTLVLLETSVGRPLSIRDVRASVAHLFSLGRFVDVVVYADRSGDGVALRYDLVPLHPVTRILYTGLAGVPGVSDAALRRTVAERFGTSPPAALADDMATFAVAWLADRGYRRARVDARVDLEHAPERATLAFTVTPGVRARLQSVHVSAPTGLALSSVASQLGVTGGSPYEPEELRRRADRYVEALKGLGYYTARVGLEPRFVDDQSVALDVTVTPGPKVLVFFTGDALPADRREELVPIAREGTADEDILEDSVLRIIEYLSGQGYRDATANFTRETTSEGDLIVTFSVARGPLYRLARVEVTGSAAVSTSELAGAMRLREGQVFSEGTLSADVSALQELYARRGYTQARVVPTAEPLTSAADARQVPVVVRIEVTENVRTVVASLRFRGNDTLASTELAAGLGLQPGQPFFPTQLVIDRDAIEQRYVNAGFRNAIVTGDPHASADGASVDIVFTVDEGTRIYVDHVLVVGNVRTKSEIIRRELQFKTGDPLGLAAVTESQRRLATLGLFRRTRITELGHGAETSRDIVVTVDEAPASTVGYGGGFEVGQFLVSDESGVASDRLEFAPRAFFEIGRRNLFGKNRSINLFTRVSFRPRNFDRQDLPEQDTRNAFSEYRIVAAYREPRVFGTAADAYLTGTLEQQRRSSFNFARRAATAEVARRLTRKVSVSGDYQINRTELFDEQIAPQDQLLIDRLFPQILLSSFSGSVARDSRDDLLGPTVGAYLSASGQLAARAIGSEVGFFKSFLTAQAFHRVPRARGLVLATSARVGLATGFPRFPANIGEAFGQPLKDLPASERFFAGGDTTVRGFALDQLGTPETLDPGGLPLGGNGLVILNFELRQRIRGGLGAVGFFDAGNVFSRVHTIELSELRGAVGFGIRYRSPVGPLRVDLGFKTNRREIVPGRLEDLTALHISLGQAF